MSVIKKILFALIIILALLNIAIWVTGSTYIYKGVANTYLKGRSGPSIIEYDIFDNRTIETGEPQEWDFSHGYNTNIVDDSLLMEMEKYQTVAYLVIKDDSIQYERYWQDFKPGSISNSFSMAKTVLSVLTGIAIKEGKIKSVDQPVSDFLPEFKEGDKHKITVRHLLTMSSGIDFDEDYSSPFAYPAKAYYGDNLKELTLQYGTKQEPGKIFRYLSGDSQLLAFVLTAATGTTVSEYASEKLWKPIGATHPALWNLDHKDGIEKGYCCFISNARDFARFGKLYLNWGKWNGIELIDSSYVAESIIPAAGLIDINGKPNEKYGFKWWLMNYNNHQIFYARGILGQYILCVPDLNMVIVRLGHKRAYNPTDDHPPDVFVYLEAAFRMYENNKENL
jgi:CubicO group peptidase (beta-lactamase class C family)